LTSKAENNIMRPLCRDALLLTARFLDVKEVRCKANLPVAALSSIARSVDRYRRWSGVPDRGPNRATRTSATVAGGGGWCACLYCCQRCLEAIEYPLELRSLLEFVDSDGDLTQDELEDDSRDFLPMQRNWMLPY
jgi:hypothetical protein